MKKNKHWNNNSVTEGRDKGDTSRSGIVNCYNLAPELKSKGQTLYFKHRATSEIETCHSELAKL